MEGGALSRCGLKKKRQCRGSELLLLLSDDTDSDAPYACPPSADSTVVSEESCRVTVVASSRPMTFAMQRALISFSHTHNTPYAHTPTPSNYKSHPTQKHPKTNLTHAPPPTQHHSALSHPLSPSARPAQPPSPYTYCVLSLLTPMLSASRVNRVIMTCGAIRK